MSEKKYPIGYYAPGNYHCTCCDCGGKFLGEKRAIQCEPCAVANKQKFDALTPDEQKELMIRNAAAIKEVFKNWGNKPGLPPLPEPILTDEDVKAWEADKRQSGALWVKISDRLPEKDHNYHVKATSRYQGYNHNDTAWWRNGAWEFQQSNRGYYVVEWYDEGTAAGREDDAVAFAEWAIRNATVTSTYDGWIYGSKRYTTAELYDIFKQQKEK